LADKVKLIQGFVTANDARDACAALTTFIAEARAQIGKKLTASQAAALTAEARTIQGLLTC
jgi:hypothetical protein